MAAGCSRLSTMFMAEVRKLATDPAAEARRTPARPAVRAGKEMLAIAEIMATTISISSSVTPPLTPTGLLPTFDIGVEFRAARLAVGAVTDDVGLVAVIAGVLIDVRMPPRIIAKILDEIRPVPLIDTARLLAQRAESLLLCREQAGIQLVLAERELNVRDLLPGSDHASLIAAMEEARPHDRGKERDDRDH